MSNNVRIEVLLNAVDRASRPLKAIQNASKSPSGDIRTSQKSLRELNAQASRNHTELFSDGAARKIEFTLSLKRVDESLAAMYGDLKTQADNLVTSASEWAGGLAG